MGLDTTHDCWHGPYSAFMRWREGLHVHIMAARGTPDPLGLDGYRRAMEQGLWPYNDENDPLDVLMSHSDCDGEIAAEMCGPLADALEKLLERMPPRALYDTLRPATERFIAGLRRAAAAGEAVEFR